MTRHFQSCLFAGVALAALALAPAKAQLFGKARGETLHLIIIENADLYAPEDVDLYNQTVRYVLTRAASGRHRASSARTKIQIIYSTRPTAAAFSGSPADLAAKGVETMEKHPLRETCNDLAAVYRQAEHSVDLMRPEEIRITHIGPGIHVPFPCDALSTIQMPQKLGKELHLGALLARDEAVSFESYLTHPDQEEMIKAHLEEAGVLARQQSGGIALSIEGQAGTITATGYLSPDKRAAREKGAQE